MGLLSFEVVEPATVSLYVLLDILILRLYSEKEMRRVEQDEDKN